MVPSRALTAQLDQRIVYVVRDGTAHMQQVQAGDERGDDTVITDGLHAGETIATDHLQQLNDGEHVQVTDSEADNDGDS